MAAPSELDGARVLLAARGVTDLRPLCGGASSLTFVGALGEQRVVVKMAPPGVPPTLHRDVLRQARIIRALAPTSVPVPEVLWEDRGEPPDVPPLFVMSFLDGTSLEPLFDDDRAGCDDTTMAERMHDAARVMAALHRLDVTEIGLGAEPVVGPEAEIDRWCRALATVEPTLAPGWQEVAEALRATLPIPLPAALVHGDFRLGNLLAQRDHVTAVIDWEIWSVGDPRVDAGWFLANADPRTYGRATPFLGATPSPAELAAGYARALGRDVPDLGWFVALACFKSAATWSLIVKHNRRRSSPDPGLEALASAVPHLVERATETLSANEGFEVVR
ncbi:aminoglycoside phosphotransferase [Mycobacterium antarcticum]|uniref:phosphotransferase family protein n=1 Tax=Mycolicibacterium sp. TUM20983 TaxID=3023369 RepID=UPI00239505DE|nr:phosphotransferase family protein [Mycolicibacterium sp. TUM20983]GLP74507.1 aminoglycoside phosphotransferase [Mycolicibacterium sp. TUM20983]